MNVNRARGTWGNNWVAVHHLSCKGDADGGDHQDHHGRDDATARRGPFAAGAVRHVGLLLAWELIVTPSGFVKSQVDFVTAASGGVHSSCGHDRCVGQCKLGKCKHTFLHVHLSCNRAVRTSQDRCGCSCLGDHYDSHYKVAKWPGNTDIDYVTGVRWVDDEV